MKNKNLIFLAAVACISSCATKNENNIPEINLEENIDTEDCGSLDNIFQIARCYELEETEASLLRSVSLIGKLNDSVNAFENTDAVYLFNDKNGKYISSFNKQGEGPEEYTFISSANISHGNNINVYDSMRGNIIEYTPDGTPKQINSVKDMDDIKPLGDGYVALTSTLYNPQLDVVRFDTNMNELDRTPVGKRDYEYKGLIRQYAMQGEGPLTVLFNDTIYSIANDGVSKAMIISRGKYNPGEIEFDIAADKTNYITDISAIIYNGYLFLKYYYKDFDYFDVWKIDNETLLSRNKFDYSNDSGISGITFDYNGKQIVFWPHRIIGDELYCKVNPEQMAEYKNSEESNPGIIVLRLRK